MLPIENQKSMGSDCDIGRLNYFPIALRSASLMRSCQPGPSFWKWSSTSRSRRIDTISLTFGTFGRSGGRSAGLVVTFLNAASAASREVSGPRFGLSNGIAGFRQSHVERGLVGERRALLDELE